MVLFDGLIGLLSARRSELRHITSMTKDIVFGKEVNGLKSKIENK